METKAIEVLDTAAKIAHEYGDRVSTMWVQDLEISFWPRSQWELQLIEQIVTELGAVKAEEQWSSDSVHFVNSEDERIEYTVFLTDMGR